MSAIEIAAPAPPRFAVPGLAPLAAVLLLLAAWQAASLALGRDGLPTVPAVLAALPEIVADPDVAVNLAASLRRMAVGYVVALAFAVPLGLAMGRSATVARLMNPLLMVVYPVPKAALMPLILLWLGVGDLAKMLVIVLGVALPVIYHAYQGARAVEEKMLWSAAAMGLGPVARMARVVLPAALPEVLVGCRTGIVLALITMVTSEMIARQSGIGSLIFTSLDLAQYETVYGLILIIAGLGIGLDAAFERVRLALVGWASPRIDVAVGSA